MAVPIKRYINPMTHTMLDDGLSRYGYLHFYEDVDCSSDNVLALTLVQADNANSANTQKRPNSKPFSEPLAHLKLW